MKSVTQKQQAVLRFLQGWQKSEGYAPSLREVARHFEMNVSAAFGHLRALEKKGLLRRQPGKGRAIVLRQEDASPSRFPLLGAIPAGAARSMEEMPHEFFDLSPGWFGKGELVALRVQGESMAGDAIRDGDLAIVKLQREARPSEIVAVRIGGTETTLKRVRLRKRRVQLIASNPAYPAREAPAEEVEILGKLVGILRRQEG